MRWHGRHMVIATVVAVAALRETRALTTLRCRSGRRKCNLRCPPSPYPCRSRRRLRCRRSRCPCRSRRRLRCRRSQPHPPRRCPAAGRPRARRGPAPRLLHAPPRRPRGRPAAEHRAPASPGARRVVRLPDRQRVIGLCRLPARCFVRVQPTRPRATARAIAAPAAAGARTAGGVRRHARPAPGARARAPRRPARLQGCVTCRDGGEPASHREACRSARAPRAAQPCAARRAPARVTHRSLRPRSPRRASA